MVELLHCHPGLLPTFPLSFPKLFKWVSKATLISTHLQHASPSPNTDRSRRTKNILSAISSLPFPTTALFSSPGDGEACTSLSQAPCPRSHAPGCSRVQHCPMAWETWHPVRRGRSIFETRDPHPDKGPIQKVSQETKISGGGPVLMLGVLLGGWSRGSMSPGSGELGPEWPGAVSQWRRHFPLHSWLSGDLNT